MSLAGFKSPLAHLVAPALVPAVMVADVRFGLAMALGMLGGWLARTGQAIEARKTWSDIKREWLVMLAMSVGSLLATLYLARLTHADELGVAAIGFAICWGGSDSLRLFRRFILSPILGAIRREEPGE